MEITITAPEDSTLEDVTERRNIPGYEDTNEGINKSSNLHHLEDKMRRKLQVFFMNPIEKWHGRGTFPIKFLVQVIKIVLVSLQLCIFCYESHNHINYVLNSKITFSHLFLKGYVADREIISYPPASGPLALYRITDFCDALDFACNSYANLSNCIGPYVYYDDNNLDPTLCIQTYKGLQLNRSYFTFNESGNDRQIVEKCNVLRKNENSEYSTRNVVSEMLRDSSAIVEARLSFSVKTIRRATNPNTDLRCYRFDISIIFENNNDDGQMTMDIKSETQNLKCPGKVFPKTITRALKSVLNALVIIICSISFVLCAISIHKAQKLKQLTVQFFRNHFDKELSMQGKQEFFNMWYIMIMIDDVMIIVGSVFKVVGEWIYVDDDYTNWCSVLLGTGNMLVWFGVLRYLGFFETYNIVILTLKNAAPRILRYVTCAIIIYAGFTLCGWLILGPYHIKFKTLMMSCECLYSLINGDDMFATFYSMSDTSLVLWWYSRIYFYSFISLYIYVILSLFVAVILDAYDTIKAYYIEGFPKNDLQEFVGTTCFEELSSGIYRGPSSASLNDLIRVNRFSRTRTSNHLTVPN